MLRYPELQSLTFSLVQGMEASSGLKNGLGVTETKEGGLHEAVWSNSMRWFGDKLRPPLY